VFQPVSTRRFPVGSALRPFSSPNQAGLEISLRCPARSAITRSRVAGILQLALERGDLVIAQGEWHSEDRAAAVSRLSEGDPLAARLASLSAPERRLLVALAVAATPLSLDLLEMATGAPGQLAPLLSGLEARGYVARTGEGWTAGHDEIAAAVLRGVAEDEHRELATELGRACLTCAGDDRASLHRAARFLAIMTTTRNTDGMDRAVCTRQNSMESVSP